MFKKIIVAVDFSPLSDRATAAAVDLAKGIGGEVVLVHVIPPGAGSDPTRVIDEVRPAIEEQLRERCAAHQASGVKLDWGVVDGSPAEELATFAARWGGHIIVVGTQGRTGLQRILLGSVTERLVRISPVPVLIVPPAHAP